MLQHLKKLASHTSCLHKALSVMFLCNAQRIREEEVGIMNKRAKLPNMAWFTLCVGKLMVGVFAFGAVAAGVYANSADDDYIKSRAREEIKRQLEKRSSQPELRSLIEKGVKKELKYSGLKPKKVKKSERLKKRQDGESRYLLPQWPYYSVFYGKRDFFQVLGDYTMASQIHNTHGKTRDFSHLVFGTDSITVKDILLVSKLAKPTAKINSAATTPGHVSFLSDVADHKLEFDAWEHHFGVSLNIARSFANGDFSFGFHIPVTGKTHRIRLKNDQDLPLINIAGMRVAYPSLGSTYRDFLNLILNSKGLEFNDRSVTQVGLGDVNGYLNVLVHSRHIDRFVIGTHVIFPSAQESDTNTLWGHELGNGGFVYLGGFFSMLWERCNWFNPYLHAKGAYGFASRVMRRVPQKIQNGAPAEALVERGIVLGKNLNFVAAPNGIFDELDSTVNRFGNLVRKIKIRPGAELLIRAGNAFTGFLNGGAFDIHYDLKIKGKSYVGSRQTDAIYDPSVVVAGSWSVGHILGCQFSYQFENMFRFGVGSSYAFAGRNYPKELSFQLDLNYEF